MLEKLPTSRELYDAEMAQRDALRGAIGQPIALISVLGTLLGTMVQKYRPNTDAGSVIFGALLVLAAYALGRAVVRLVQAYHGHTYKGIPTALEIKRTHEDLSNWYRESGQEAAFADIDIRNQLDEEYAVAADHNAQVNRRKTDFLYLANRYIVVAGAATAAAFVPFLLNQVLTEPPPSVQVVDVAPRLYFEYLRHGRQQAHTTAVQPAGPPPQAGASAAKGSSRGADNPAPKVKAR